MTLSRHNLGEAIPADLPEEFSEILARGKNVRIERIVSRGHASEPGFWYDQDEDEFVLVVSGKARLEFAEKQETMSLGPGDWLVIPAHCRHRVAWTDPEQDTVWLAVFLR